MTPTSLLCLYCGTPTRAVVWVGTFRACHEHRGKARNDAWAVLEVKKRARGSNV